ncbi:MULTISPECIES: hypothetical protein [unclassified Acinetobacter]|uniref:hypothetical protein n=1 Tax=unclassified Acinetobacter TaxID=196816 RepID=UPI00190A614D|nr:MULTISPECIES: hypothetical protein [unclassified Acinetobacter]MBK0062146.1 hypothetical protein [Acinetobacter sp. S55]MBK0065950.1 hypothetical protein [Acinetobacter sp. S54]
MGFFSWLFSSKKPEEPPIPSKKRKRGEYGFEERCLYHSNELQKYKHSNLKIKKIKIIADKDNPDTCTAIKKLRKIHHIDDVPAIPLSSEKCQNCTCYYEPIVSERY